MSKPKRFYRDVTLAPAEDGHAVALDGRPARTAGREVLRAPQRLAEALREEWDGQTEEIDLAAMPLTRIQGFVLDAGEEGRAEFVATVKSYAGSDLLCYRAEDGELARRQAEIFEPFLELARADGLEFRTTAGIVPIEQPRETLEALGQRLGDIRTEELFPRKLLTEITGSAILALYAEQNPDAAFAASRLDETFQAERWGVDSEAREREEMLRRDYDDVLRYLALVSA